MSKIISPNDFLIAMVHYLPKGRKCFEYDSERLNRFLYQQKQQYPKTLNSFGFKDNGQWSTSDELSQAISNLFATKFIVVGSARPWDWHFDPECEEYYQNIIKARIPQERLSDIEAIALTFDEQLAIDESMTSENVISR